MFGLLKRNLMEGVNYYDNYDVHIPKLKTSWNWVWHTETSQTKQDTVVCALSDQSEAAVMLRDTCSRPAVFTSESAVSSEGFTNTTVSRTSLQYWRIRWPAVKHDRKYDLVMSLRSNNDKKHIVTMFQRLFSACLSCFRVNLHYTPTSLDNPPNMKFTSKSCRKVSH